MFTETSQLPEGEKCSCKGYTLDKLLQPNILSLLAKGDLHGYHIIQELENRNLFMGERTDNTGVYRALKTMEEKDLLSSRWDVIGGGPAKRVYSITPKGLECLSRWVETLEAYQKTIALIIEEGQSALSSLNT